MNKELELWQFIADHLHRSENVMLLVVAESSGSSPGRAGYKMAIGADGTLCGSIGGGVMEVNLVEQSRSILSEPTELAGGINTSIDEQIHRKDSPNASGMICSGKQSVIFKRLTQADALNVETILDSLKDRTPTLLVLKPTTVKVEPVNEKTSTDIHFERLSDTAFEYTEQLCLKNELYIIGGGHCSLALSEIMSKMDFHISIFDDRPDLNTIEKNRFAHEINIIARYENIGDSIRSGENVYVVVMTLGYKSDAVIIRQLIGKDLKYFGVLGSKAKMAMLLSELTLEGFPVAKLALIHTPIGLPINSRTPEEIAVSIAAEIISVKNK